MKNYLKPEYQKNTSFKCLFECQKKVNVGIKMLISDAAEVNMYGEYH